MKRFLSVLLIMMLCMGIFSCTAVLAEVEGDFEYSLTFDNGASIVKYTGSATELVIPDTLGGLPVKEIGGGAFENCTSLVSVALPESVEVIGSNAFSNCTSLANIQLCEQVWLIDSDSFSNTAFYNNPDHWENGVLYLDDILLDVKKDFSGDYSVKEGTRMIGSHAFVNVVGLTGINFPKSLKIIGKEVFIGCSGLSSLTIDVDLLRIDKGAFVCGKQLTSVTISGNVQEIDDDYTFGYWYDEEQDDVFPVEGFTIRGIPGSAAEEYAKIVGVAFEAITESLENTEDSSSTTGSTQPGTTVTPTSTETPTNAPSQGGDDSSKLVMVIIIAAGVLVVAAGIFGFLMWKKKKNNQDNIPRWN